ncbi:ESAT-6-like protein EsxF [Mycobacterium simulans]|uniref:ESAT-6-like protein n=1 Tax=Mycobacterium simulans TaxID=627089 RepID=A0A7Z7IIN6_9MYCO|nr:WXG100 family type VII secretion target [Mycobacterium simulans]SOJ53238.1 ESAT-6-like protein EsxF [Mycobacterium simulans]SON59022.1 ESAT-6-like protein EsxF [Mycobacterium simulans]
MAADDNLRVDPLVMHGFAEALAGGAADLRSRLAELDGRVGEMLGGWRGASGSAYTAAWELWHRGADEVQLGLSILAQSLAQAGVGYRQNEAAAQQALRVVGDA